MNEKDKLSFTEGEEEEFHITDEDIDRELAAMEVEHISADGNTSSETPIDTPEVKQRFGKLTQLKRKHWIIITFIIIILLFVLLKIMGNSSSSASFDQITPVAVPSTPATMPAQQSQTDLSKATFGSKQSSQKTDDLLSTPTLRVPTKTQAATLTTSESKLVETLNEIQQQNKMLTQQLASVSDRLQGLESSFNQSNQAVKGLSQQVVQLDDGKKVTMPMKSVAPPPTSVAAAIGPQYTVEAVVPQRAWLQASDGSTMTVMVGDEVPGLGSVAAIDPYSGNVTTSSGAVLKYGN